MPHGEREAHAGAYRALTTIYYSRAGKDSDISYYLNSHHIDVHSWYLSGLPGDWRPTRVTASGSSGTATSLGCVDGTEDTISLLVDWEAGQDSKRRGTAVYTASWTAPNGSGVHSEQHFHYMGSKGEIRVNQSRRGYNVCVDGQGTADINGQLRRARLIISAHC